jgi:hypothetical protein
VSIDETRVREPQRDRRSDDRYGRYDEPALDWVSLREGWEQERAREQAKNPPPVLQHGPVVGENHFVGDPVHDNKNYAMGKMRREIANSYYNHSLIWPRVDDREWADARFGEAIFEGLEGCYLLYVISGDYTCASWVPWILYNWD